MRWLTRSLLVLTAVALVTSAAVLFAVRGSLPPLEGVRSAAGLAADTVIERDAFGAVTIHGHSREDLAYATGYVHAQDRFFQMDLARRIAAGRLSELVGDAAFETDANSRLHRFASVTDAVFANLASSERAVLEAYAGGANAGLASLRVRPFEYLLLRQRPEPWHARDSLLVVFAMYLDLNDSDASSDRQRGLLAATLPAEVFRYVYSVAPTWEAPIDGIVMAAEPMPGPEALDLRHFRKELEQVAASAGRHTTAENSAVGSNNWAVAGTHTRSGAAMLANDMHLGLRVPGTWYRARLRLEGAGRRDLMGLTLPGAPIMVVGSNGRVAWGFTNSHGDWTDLVQVERSPDGTRYRGATGWKPIERVTERIQSSSGATRDVTVEATEWGPLLPAPGAQGGPRVALAWTAHDPAATNLRWLELETAEDCRAALSLANTVGGPAQNFVCADAQGQIGWTLLGRLPRRGSGYDPRVPSDWTRPDAGWQGWLDPADYPRVLNPPSGRIWTANNRVVGAAALAAIGDGSPDRGARAQQIRDQLFALGPRAATERDMLAIQLDDRALFLTRWRDLLLESLGPQAVAGNARRAAFRTQVERWKPRASVDSAGYLLVRTFHETLERRIFDALTVPARRTDATLELEVPRQFEEAVWELATRQPTHLLDPHFASWREFLLDVVDQSLDEVGERCVDATLAACTWGTVNSTRIRHPLSRAMPGLARWLDMPRQPMAGDHDMPRVHAPGFGASERLAVSPGHEAQGYLHMPGGQSGHPLSPYYRAGHDAWVEGRPLPYLPGPAVHRLTLRGAASN